MDIIRYLLIFFLFFSGTCFAGDYPASYKWPCKKTDYNTTSSAFSDSPIYTDYSQCIAAYNANKTNSDFSFQATVYSGYDSVDFYNQGTLFQPHLVINIKQPYCPYGGSLSGTQCINAPSQTCPASGIKKVVSVCNSSSIKESDGVATITIDGNNGAKTAVQGACEYEYTAADYDEAAGCFVPDGASAVNGGYEVCCSYNATSKGIGTTATDTAKDPVEAKPGSTPVPSSDSGNCISDLKGNKVCQSDSSDSGKTCGTVNGSKVCVDKTDPNAQPTINDKQVTPTENCFWINGKLSCVSSGSVPSSTREGCVIGANGQEYCVNRDVKETEETTKVVAPDGTITTTKNKRNNVIGDDDYEEIITQNPDGSTTTTKSGDDGTRDSDCVKNPNALACQDITKGTVPAPDVIPHIDVPVSLEYTAWGDGGSCPSDVSVDSFGHAFSYEPMCDLAVGINPVVVASSFIAAALIVFGAVKEG